MAPILPYNLSISSTFSLLGYGSDNQIVQTDLIYLNKNLTISSGNIGIGTTAPQTQFQVWTGGSLASVGGYQASNGYPSSTLASFVSPLIYGSTGRYDIEIGSASTAVGNLTNTYKWLMGVNYAGNASYLGGNFEITSVQANASRYTGADTRTARFVINNAGNVGIGTANPNATLHLNTSSGRSLDIITSDTGITAYIQAGSAPNQGVTLFYFVNYNNSVIRGTITSTSDSTTLYTSGSDRRIKNSIRDLPDIRSLVEKLRPRGFKMNYDISNQEHYGFIAQEVQEHYPVLVAGNETETSTLQLDYGTFSPFAVGGVLDLYKITDASNDRITMLESTIQTQSDQIAQLMQRLAAAGIA